MIRRCFLLVCCSMIPVALTARQLPNEKAKTINERVAALETESAIASMRLDEIDAMRSADSAHLDCSTGTFTYLGLQNSGLAFLVSCRKIEPYLEGFKLTLSVGNPYSMRFDGFTASLGYGDTSIKTIKQAIAVSSISGLSPGLWNVVTVTINQIAAKDLRYIYLRKFTITQAQSGG